MDHDLPLDDLTPPTLASRQSDLIRDAGSDIDRTGFHDSALERRGSHATVLRAAVPVWTLARSTPAASRTEPPAPPSTSSWTGRCCGLARPSPPNPAA